MAKGHSQSALKSKLIREENLKEMKPTMTVLERIKQNSNKNKEETFTRLYRYLLRPDIYYQAYKNLYANNGAATKGIDNDTADGFSEAKIEEIIAMLKDETYTPKTVRRIYRKKPNGKQRPIGIPTFTDKLVQEVLRMVLETVYEPVFLECSHGFRPNKSCHTALESMKYGFNGTRWFLEGDIKSCFDNINHAVLIELITKKVKDARLIKLIYKFLKAGYLEDWQYHTTYSGVPQGGIVSPLFTNIYMHELDKFVINTLKTEFDYPAEHSYTPQYRTLRNRLRYLRKYINKSKGTEKQQQYIDKVKSAHKLLLKTPSKSQTDKKIKYQRYADDFLVGVNGNHEDCLWIKNRLSTFISTFLRMELCIEKTLITHSSQCVRFLGYDVCINRNSTIRACGKKRYTRRTLMNHVNLSVPFKDKIQQFVLSKGIAKIKNGSLVPVHRSILVNCTDLEIIATYNAELRGICNFYGLAGDFYKLNYFGYLMEYSCLKTYAAKYRCDLGKIKRKFKDGKGRWCIPYETKTGRKYMYFAKYADGKKVKTPVDTMVNAVGIYAYSRTTFESRLKAKVCELCGTTQSKCFEVHHVNKVKNLKGKELWERAMIAKKRKTLVVCKECHYMIHRERVLLNKQ
jgi:group II intron reverse transcriptase/maturase